MPTHQGKTQTDIVIGTGGDEASLDSRFEFSISYGASADFQYVDNVPSADEEDSNYEIQITDASGLIASLAAEYTSEPITGTATNVSSTRTNTFKPAPNGSSPGFPSGGATFCSRIWEISSTSGGSTFAGFKSTWKFTSTVVSGGTVTQTINKQNNDQLKVTWVYKNSGGVTIANAVITCYATAQATASVVLGSPSVTDVT